MNKREQEFVESLQVRVALCWTGPVEPDVMPPESSVELSVGYLPSSETANYPDVSEACSSCVFHGIGSQAETRSQGARKLYSTKVLALRALRHRMELLFAKRLRAVDSLIEQEVL